MHTYDMELDESEDEAAEQATTAKKVWQCCICHVCVRELDRNDRDRARVRLSSPPLSFLEYLARFPFHSPFRRR
jgi:hypothetical protein